MSTHEAIARSMFEAFRDRRRDIAERLLSSDFTFTSPYDDAIDRETYFARCWPNGDRFAQFTIERIAADGDGAYVTYLVTGKDGLSFRNSEYLRIAAGKISSVDVYFGASYRDGAFVAKEQENA
jgi:ketosteroid isomerase-like protein